MFPPPIKSIFFDIGSLWPKASNVSWICDALIETYALSFFFITSFFLRNMNLLSLTTPNMFALSLGNFLVSSLSLILLIGHLSSTKISKSLILLFANGTLSVAPGDSSFLWIDFAISISGEITKSIGRFSLLNNCENFGSKYSWARILAIFFGVLNNE